MGIEPRAPGNNPDQESDAATASNPTYKALLEKREYDRLAHLLEGSSSAVKQQRSPVAASLITAALQICQVCLDCQEQKAHLQHLHETAAARERNLRQTLQSILLLLGKVEDGQLEGTSASDLGLETAVAAGSGVQQGLWQRIQDLLRLAPPAEPAQKIEPLVLTIPEEPAALDAGASASPALSPPLEPGDQEGSRRAEISPPQETESLDGGATGDPRPSLVVYCLGPFQAYLDDQLVESWPSGKGKAIFKYLVTHREIPTAKEVLMELFWPDADPDAARNNLNVAIYGLRQALRNGGSPTISHILFQDDAYLLNPDLKVWVDVEEFLERFNQARELEQEGDLQGAIREYFTAEALYQLEFLSEDRYDDWILTRRQRLQITYLSLLERLSRYHYENGDYAACITVCHKMLAIDSCREDAHRLLMHCYERQGQRYLALRQYHLCASCLQEELDVSPTPDTIALYEELRR